MDSTVLGEKVVTELSKKPMISPGKWLLLSLCGAFFLACGQPGSLSGAMRKAEAARLQGERALPEAQGSALAAAARKVAQHMEVVRDRFSPDPDFYALAEKVREEADKSARLATEGDLNGAKIAWGSAKEGCRRCHARYGGP